MSNLLVKLMMDLSLQGHSSQPTTGGMTAGEAAQVQAEQRRMGGQYD
jgi:hypothetical protein